MLAVLLSSILIIFGILMAVIGTLGLIVFIVAIVFWVVEGELGYEGNPWLLLISWFIIATMLSGAGLALVRIFG